MASPTVEPPRDLGAVFEAERRLLFALSYRLTGSAEDSEEVVQESFARALERPPPRTAGPWRPWLVRVAVNLSLDLLRRRRRRRTPGSWLPTPIDSSELELPAEAEAAAGASPERRYELAESATFAFLLALEALTPQQRAVLILGDVFDHSARETGELLGLSEGNARVILHRARRAMRAYDVARCRPTRELESRTRQQLEALVRCLVQQDVGGLTRLLAEDVRALTDAAGEYTALNGPLVGRAGVMRLLLSVAGRRSGGASLAPRLVNGLPAVLVEFARSERRQAPCLLLRCELDGAGRIREVHALLGPRKLAALLPAPA